MAVEDDVVNIKYDDGSDDGGAALLLLPTARQ